MANEGGIRQYIRLALDQHSVAQVKQQAAEASQEVGKALTRGIADPATMQRQVHAYVLNLRETLEASLANIQKSVADGIMSEQAAEFHANKVGSAYRQSLRQALMPLGSEQREMLNDLLRLDPEELTGNVRQVGKQLRAALEKEAPELITAGIALGEALQKGVNKVMASGATLSTEVVAKIRAAGQEAQAELRRNLSLAQREAPVDQFSEHNAGVVTAVTQYKNKIKELFKGFGVGTDMLRAELMAPLHDIPKLLVQSIEQEKGNLASLAGPAHALGEEAGKVTGVAIHQGQRDALIASLTDLRHEFDKDIRDSMHMSTEDRDFVMKEFQSQIAEIVTGAGLEMHRLPGLVSSMWRNQGLDLEHSLERIFDPFTKGGESAPKMVLDKVEKTGEQIGKQVGEELLKGVQRGEQQAEKQFLEHPQGLVSLKTSDSVFERQQKEISQSIDAAYRLELENEKKQKALEDANERRADKWDAAYSRGVDRYFDKYAKGRDKDFGQFFTAEQLKDRDQLDRLLEKEVNQSLKEAGFLEQITIGKKDVAAAAQSLTDAEKKVVQEESKLADEVKKEASGRTKIADVLKAAQDQFVKNMLEGRSTKEADKVRLRTLSNLLQGAGLSQEEHMALVDEHGKASIAAFNKAVAARTAEYEKKQQELAKAVASEKQVVQEEQKLAAEVKKEAVPLKEAVVAEKQVVQEVQQLATEVQAEAAPLKEAIAAETESQRLIREFNEKNAERAGAKQPIHSSFASFEAGIKKLEAEAKARLAEAKKNARAAAQQVLKGGGPLSPETRAVLEGILPDPSQVEAAAKVLAEREVQAAVKGTAEGAKASGPAIENAGAQLGEQIGKGVASGIKAKVDPRLAIDAVKQKLDPIRNELANELNRLIKLVGLKKMDVGTADVMAERLRDDFNQVLLRAVKKLGDTVSPEAKAALINGFRVDPADSLKSLATQLQQKITQQDMSPVGAALGKKINQELEAGGNKFNPQAAVEAVRSHLAPMRAELGKELSNLVKNVQIGKMQAGEAGVIAQRMVNEFNQIVRFVTRTVGQGLTKDTQLKLADVFRIKSEDTVEVIRATKHIAATAVKTGAQVFKEAQPILSAELDKLLEPATPPETKGRNFATRIIFGIGDELRRRAKQLEQSVESTVGKAFEQEALLVAGRAAKSGQGIAPLSWAEMTGKGRSGPGQLGPATLEMQEAFDRIIAHIAPLKARLDAEIQKLIEGVGAGKVEQAAATRLARRLGDSFNTTVASVVSSLGKRLPTETRGLFSNMMFVVNDQLAEAVRTVKPPQTMSFAEAIKQSIRRARTDGGVKQEAEATAQQVKKTLDTGLTEALRRTTRSPFVEWIKSSFSGMQGFGSEFAKRGEEAASSWWQSFTRTLKGMTTLYHIPMPEEVDISRGQELSMRAAARRGSKGNAIREEELYQKALEKTIVAAQVQGTQLTVLGRVMQRLGIDTRSASRDVQDLEKMFDKLRGTTAGGGPPGFVPGGGGGGGGGGGWLGGLGGMFGGMAGGILRAASALGIFYGAWQVLQGIKQSVKEFGETDKMWHLLSQTLGDFGMKLSEVQPQMIKMVDAGKDLGFQEKETVQMFTTLMQLTGNYEKSMKGLTVAMDLVAGRHLTFEMAAKVTSRAILGDVGALSRYGIVLDRTKDPLDQLIQRLGGDAAAAAQSFEGSMKRVKVAWNDVQIALGQALVEQGGGQGVMDHVIASLKLMTQIIHENAEFFRVLGVAASVALNIILGGIQAVNVLFKSVITLVGSLTVGVKAVWPAFVIGFDEAMKGISSGLRLIAQLVDKIFHTGFKIQFDILMAHIDENIANRKKQLDQLGKDWDEGMRKTWAQAPELHGKPGEGGGASWGTDTGEPKAPDSVIGHADVIRSQQAHTTLSRTINLLGQQALSKKDAEESQRAQEKLNELLSEQKAKYDELSSSEEARLLNAGELLETHKHITDIEKIQAKIAKQAADDSAQRKADAAVMAYIEQQRRVAESKNQEAAARAEQNLLKLRNQLEDKLRAAPEFGKRYWVIADQIRATEQAITEIMTKRDDKFTKQLETLSKMVEHRVNEKWATEQLKKLQEENTKEMIIQQVMLGRDETAMGRLLLLAERRRQIETALNTVAGERQKKIDDLIKGLEDPEKRKQAEQDLLSLRKQLVAEQYNEKKTADDLLITKNQIKQIDEALTSSVTKRIKLLEEELKAAKKLYEPPESTSRTLSRIRTYGTRDHRIKVTEEEVKTSGREGRGTLEDRDKAIEKYRSIIQDINELLAEQPKTAAKTIDELLAEGRSFEEINKIVNEGVVTTQERLKLEGMLAEAIRRLQKIQEPTLNFYKDLKQILIHDMPSMSEQAASQVAETWENTFARLGLSAAALRETIVNTPKGLAKAMLKELADMAKGQAKAHLAWSIGEIAKGIGRLAVLDAAGAGTHFLSAGKHILAATAWSALGGSALSHSGAGGGTATNQQAQDTNNQVDEKRGMGTIIIKGGLLNTDDREQMDAFGKAMRVATGYDWTIMRGS